MSIEQSFAPILLAGSTALMFLTVPLRRIRSLLGWGLVAGLGVATALVYLMQVVYGFWDFRNADPLSYAGIPWTLGLSWIPLVIVFSDFVRRRSLWLTAASLVVFPVGAVLTHWYMLQNGMLIYRNWSLPATFLISLGIHLAILASVNTARIRAES
ncbi:MAG: hypothetical protein AB1331_09755 [Bacillota bacterium]